MSPLVSVRVTSSELGVPASTLYDLVRRHEIPFHKFGDRIFLDPEEVRKATHFEPGLLVVDRMTGTIANVNAPFSAPVSAKCPQKRRAK